MSKRFTDTNKFDDPWFCDLSKDAKLAWEFILAKCDNAGVWEPNLRIASAYLPGIAWEDVLKEFGDRVIVLPNGKWWAWKFVSFQYGKLNPECRPHQSIIRLLKQHGLFDRLISLQNDAKNGPSHEGTKGIDTLSIGYPKGIHTLKDKDKEKEKDKEEGCGEEPESEDASAIENLALVGMGGDAVPPRRNVRAESEQIYAAYPRKVARPEALRAIEKQLRKHPFDFLLACTQRYAATPGRDPQFTPHPATWFNQERFNDDPATWGQAPAAQGPQPSPPKPLGDDFQAYLAEHPEVARAAGGWKTTKDLPLSIKEEFFRWRKYGKVR